MSLELYHHQEEINNRLAQNQSLLIGLAQKAKEAYRDFGKLWNLFVQSDTEGQPGPELRIAFKNYQEAHLVYTKALLSDFGSKRDILLNQTSVFLSRDPELARVDSEYRRCQKIASDIYDTVLRVTEGYNLSVERKRGSFSSKIRVASGKIRS